MSDYTPTPEEIRVMVQRALEEDLGSGDVTALLIPHSSEASAKVICRDEAVICGRAWFDAAFLMLDADARIDWRVADGDSVHPEQLLCTVDGNARALLSAERTALNFLQTLSGTATRTQRYAREIEGTRARILDTRKTLPGLRRAQKYAVRCGGGHNHRIGLFDAILIKENHILAAGSITRAVDTARDLHPKLPIEVEVENLAELEEALQAGVHRVLLDNMDPDMLRQAVADTGGRAALEASGGISLENLRQIAETGVDFISIGALTKDVTAVDLSMRFEVTGF